MLDNEINPPAGVPRDLLSKEDRPDLPGNTLWIRTWFGDPTDKTSQEAADAAYARLRLKALQQGINYDIDCIDEECIFENRQELSADSPREEDIIGGVAVGRPGSVPGYLITVLMHCPELFEGTTDYEWRYFAGEKRAEELADSDRTQNAVVFVADRKACEEGWVLGLAVNHRGQVLPFRVRERAQGVGQIMVNWLEGMALSEMADDEDEDVECYLREGDGWGPT